jgi:drug/metabolite transporter (DMT)-like permease
MSRNTADGTPVIAQLVLLGAIWGGAFTLIKILVDDLSPLEIAAGRLALGAAAVIVVFRIRHQLRMPARDLIAPIALVAAADTLIPYVLVGWAEARIDSGAAAVLISIMPMFTVLFAAATMRDEVVGPARLGGIAVGFVGVLMLVGGPSALLASTAIGQIAVIAAAASYAAGSLYARQLLKRTDAANLTAAKLTIGATIAFVAMLATGGGGGLLALDAGNAVSLSVLGVVCTGISFVMYFRLVSRVGSVGASTVTYIIPVFGLLFGALTLGETIEAGTLAGMTLIISGVAGVMYAPWFEAHLRGVFTRHAPSVPVA